MIRVSRALLVVLALATASPLAAARPVPAPREVLGFTPGERAVRHADIVRYLEALAKASDRVRLRRYGRTHEGRDLLLLIVTSEKNQARLDGIRVALERLADPRLEVPRDFRERLLRQTPAVAFLAYSIHGDEYSGADAALLVAHELATSDAPEIIRMRDELVMLIDPLQNPDGRERVLAMNATYSGAVANPDPEALSHQGIWPWGRSNHYLFDLNRDWFVLVHPETRGRAKVIRQWNPQLVVDAHEMGSRSTYLFNPPREPFNPLLPSSTRSWWDRFSADQARAFDEHGWSYYTREWNEEFFPGYGSSMPLYGGAVGILYEQASSDAQPVRKPHGDVMTYAETVERQRVSTLANLSTAARHREELVRSWRAAREEAIERGRRGPVRAFYFGPGPDRVRAARLASRLAQLGIEVERLASTGGLPQAHGFWDDEHHDVTLEVGTYRVRTDQPAGLLARVVLTPHLAMPDAFLAEQREHLERQKGSRIYDTTAWSPLLASGLDAWWAHRLDSLTWEPVAVNERIRGGGVLDGDATYGWLWSGTTDGALALAAELTAQGYRVRVGDEAFTQAGRRMPAGSFLVRAEENGDGVQADLLRAAPARSVEVFPTASARVLDGPDLGGGHWTLLAEARIGIVAGAGTDTTSVGAAWNLLDHELGLRVSLLDLPRLRSLDLRRYNVIVLPNAWGGGGTYRRALGESGLAALRSWVEAGGTLVGIAGGALLAADEESGFSAVRRRRDVLDEHPSPRFGLPAEATAALARMQGLGLASDGTVVKPAGELEANSWPSELGIPGPGSPVLGPGTWALLGPGGEAARRRGAPKPVKADDAGKADEDELERQDERLRRFMPSGAILAVDLDPEHWLSHGMGDRVAVMARERHALIARDPVRIVGRHGAPGDLHLGGLLWPEGAGRVAHTAWLTREGKGRGQVILFAGEPNFRGYFWGSERLFLNAVLLGPGLGTRRTIPW